jgi:hypothetical protein
MSNHERPIAVDRTGLILGYQCAFCHEEVQVRYTYHTEISFLIGDKEMKSVAVCRLCYEMVKRSLE